MKPKPAPESTGLIIPKMPWEQYLALDDLNCSKLKVMAHSAKHYRHNAQQGKETEVLSLGKATHCAVLEPERFNSSYCIWRRRTDGGNLAPRNGQFYKAFLAENPGKEDITEDEETAVLTMQHAIRSDATAMKYLLDGAAEVTMRWRNGKRPCKARTDWLNGRNLVGLKTAVDVRAREFSIAANRLGYHLAWAWYADGYETITGHPPDNVVEIVVEKSPPHDVVVNLIPERVIEIGRHEYLELLERLGECEKRGFWPGVGGDAEVEFDLPDYKYREDDDISGAGLKW